MMTNLKDWLTNFLSGREGYLTQSKKDEAVKMTEALITQLGENCQVAEGLKDVTSLAEQYITKARPKETKQHELISDSLVSKLLNLLVAAASVDGEIHGFLRDETTILSTLASSLNHNYRKNDYTNILRTIEVLTRGLSLTWAAPYLRHAVKGVLAILQETAASDEDYLYAVRIMTNILHGNRSCLNLVVGDPNFKDCMKRLYMLLSKTDCPREVMVLNLNLSYLTEQFVDVQLQTQMENINATFGELQGKVERANTFESLRRIASTIYYLSLSVSTLLHRIQQGQGKNTTDSAIQEDVDLDVSGASLIKSITESVLGTAFTKLFPKCLPVMRLESGQILLHSLINLIKGLCPTHVPPEFYNDQWTSFVKALNEVAMITPPKSKEQVRVLELHLHMVDRIAKANPQNFCVDSFTYALNSTQIVLSPAPLDLSRNILTIRLARQLSGLASSLGDSKDIVANKINKVLREETLTGLLALLLSQDHEETLAPCLNLSTCIVEILHVISNYPKTPTTFIENLQNEKTWLHMANCILNGDEELMRKAFALMTAVGFSQNCRAGVAKTVSLMREFPPTIKSPAKSPERFLDTSAAVVRGMNKLTSNLELLENGKKELGFEIDDVLAWYKMKTDMHELEMANATEHIAHLNRTIAQLKSLMNKQSELVANRTLSSVMIQRDFNGLQEQLNATKEKKVQLEMKHMKALESLRHLTTHQEAAIQAETAKLKKLSEENSTLKEQCAKLQASKKEADQSSQQLTKDKRKLEERVDELEKECKLSKQKAHSLGVDLKKSEETLKAVQAQLEAEKRKTEIIQQVLGNRMS